MKKLLLALMVFAAANTYAAKPSKNVSFKVDASKSKVEWLAKKVTGQHNGTVVLTNGNLLVSGEKITGGSFTIDMRSIACLDLTGEWNDKLVGHLKSDDFFSVENNPTSKFDITKVIEKEGNTVIEGNLTIKGITKPISFPASISKKGDVLVAIATIKIDRTKYDIKYGSKSFIEGIGDKAIDDDFEMKVNIIATAAKTK